MVWVWFRIRERTQTWTQHFAARPPNRRTTRRTTRRTGPRASPRPRSRRCSPAPSTTPKTLIWQASAPMRPRCFVASTPANPMGSIFCDRSSAPSERSPPSARRSSATTDPTSTSAPVSSSTSAASSSMSAPSTSAMARRSVQRSRSTPPITPATPPSAVPDLRTAGKSTSAATSGSAAEQLCYPELQLPTTLSSAPAASSP